MTAVTTAQSGFAELLQRHRRELHVHCYRMLGSFDEAEDVVQETQLRAWNKRDVVEVGPAFRAWLYRIATNGCLDVLRSRGRRPVALDSLADISWLQPYPDRLLDEVTTGPEAVTMARETIELAFLAAVQILPPQQRAVLLLRDVLGWSAAESAAAMATSVAAANSALQRARVALREHLPAVRSEWSVAAPSAAERAVLDRFVDAHNRADDAAMTALVRHDLRVTMPPQPMCFDGVEALQPLRDKAIAMGDWWFVPTAANRQPAAANYLRRPGDTQFRAFKIDVLRLDGDLVAEITTFGAGFFTPFGLPEVLRR
ncbi:RNA polymerase subunit sigma-70 [Pseudonocardia sp. GCM10023141]|uniref:RNA polymerase subunit sigma-70 n=1 Tax=Pseudonocardia sp. GCM10023141 TaxID=3252653 RepID=UPI003605F756